MNIEIQHMHTQIRSTGFDMLWLILLIAIRAIFDWIQCDFFVGFNALDCFLNVKNKLSALNALEVVIYTEMIIVRKW